MKISPLRVRVLIQKELRQLFRDPKTKRIIFAAPIIQLLLFGYAVNTDVRNVATVVVDQDRTAESRLLQETLTASGYFRIVEVGRMIRRTSKGPWMEGRPWWEFRFRRVRPGPEGRERRPRPRFSSTAPTPTRPPWPRGMPGGSSRISPRTRLPDRGMAWRGGIDLRVRAWYNPDLSSQVYNVPGVIGLLLLLMALLLTTLAVVRERELGTLEQLMVSPINPRELILGKTIPVVVICMVDLVLITTLAVLWFHIPLRGSGGGPGPGLLPLRPGRAGARALHLHHLQDPAGSLPHHVPLPPSGHHPLGFMYPVDTMPEFFQYLTLLNPVRYFMEMVRGIFLKGQGVADLWGHLRLRDGHGGRCGGGSRRFKKSLE